MPLPHHCFVTVAALLGIAAGAAEAQIPLTTRALGLGGAFVASARGFESVFYNPANLALSGGPAWSVAIPQISLGSSVLGPDVSDLPDFIDYDDLTEARKDELLASIPTGGTAVDLDVRAPLTAVQVGRFGIGVAYGLLGEHTVGRDLVELFFEGFDPDRGYRIGNTVGTRASFWDLSAAYAQEVGPVSVGVTGHYILGRGLVRTRAFEPRFTGIAVLQPDIEVDYVGVASEGGSGYGLDVGVAVQPASGVTLSAAVANVVSSMDWDDELIGRQITLTSRDFESSSFIALRERYDESEQRLGEDPAEPFRTVARELDPDQWSFPTTLRLGAAWAAPTGTQLTAAYHNALSDGRLGGRWEQLLGLGVQQRIPLVTLRLGGSTNLEDGTLLGGGVRLGPLDFGVAHYTAADELDQSVDRDGWAASFSVSVQAGGGMH
jgi:hypothetical protein